MSVLFKKPVIEKAGGLTSLGKYINADDHQLVDIMKRSGKNVVLSGEVCLQNHSSVTLYDFCKRLSRWAKQAYRANPYTILVLFMIFPGPAMGMTIAWAANHLFGWNPALIFIVHVAVCTCLDHKLLTTIQVILHRNSFSATRHLFFSIEPYSIIASFKVELNEIFGTTFTYSTIKFKKPFVALPRTLKKQPIV